MGNGKTFNWECRRATRAGDVSIQITVVVHSSVPSIVAAFFGVDEIDILTDLERVSEHSGKTAMHHFRNCKANGSWGWSDIAHRILHVWYDRENSIQTALRDLTTTLSHEQGHLFGTPWESYDMEELRASGYEVVATSSFDLARHIIGAECGIARSVVELRDLIGTQGAALCQMNDTSSLAAQCDAMINRLMELRMSLGVA